MSAEGEGSSASESDRGLSDISPRQREVLDATLALIVEAPATLTMAAVASRANCSKETLYKWFGDRGGLLTATVRWQAAKVGGTALDPQELDRPMLEGALRRFAADWLTVISGETSVALNRVAISQGGGGGRRNLGTIVLENGPFAMRSRLGRMLELGRDARLLGFDDTQEAFGTFFGLVVRDVQIRLLLGERLEFSRDAIAHAAERAVRHFFVLYGRTDETAPGPATIATS